MTKPIITEDSVHFDLYKSLTRERYAALKGVTGVPDVQNLFFCKINKIENFSETSATNNNFPLNSRYTTLSLIDYYATPKFVKLFNFSHFMWRFERK